MSKTFSPETPKLGDLVRIPARIPGNADHVGRVVRVDVLRGYYNPAERIRYYRVEGYGLMVADAVKVEQVTA